MDEIGRGNEGYDDDNDGNDDNIDDFNPPTEETKLITNDDFGDPITEEKKLITNDDNHHHHTLINLVMNLVVE